MSCVGGGQITDVTWINTAGGSWNVAANWRDGSGANRVPTASDNVLIAQPGIYTVTLASPVTVNSLSLGGGAGTQTLNAGATFTLNAPSLVGPAGVFNLNSSLSGAADLTVNGSMSWAGGTIGGSGTISIAAGATLNITLTDSANLFLQRTLNNAGTVVLTSTTNFDRLFLRNGTLNNQAGAVFDFRGDRGLLGSGGINAVQQCRHLAKECDERDKYDRSAVEQQRHG